MHITKLIKLTNELRTKTGSAPSDTNQGVDTKRPKMMSPRESGDHDDDDNSGPLGKSTGDPCVSDCNSNLNKKNENSNLFPIFNNKKANMNFTSSSKAPVFAAKKKSEEPRSHPSRKRTAAATKKKPKPSNLKGENSILKYLNTFQGTS